MALRGWGPADFEAAHPVFLDAIHLALFAEALGPEIVKAQETLATDMAGLPLAQKAVIARAKAEAPARLASLRGILGLDDG